MALEIVKIRLLRTGDVSISGTSAKSVDKYLVTVNERCSKEQLIALFIDTVDSPVPKQTAKEFLGGWLVCDSIDATLAKEQASKVWLVSVSWKEIGSAEPPEQRDFPVPDAIAGAVKSPEDWQHTWSRRSHIVFVEKDQVKLFYKGGYSGAAHSLLSTDPDERKLFQASNFLPFKNPPAVRRLKTVWNFRWIKFSCPASLRDAEGKLNSVDFTISKAGLSWVLKAHTALIDSVELSSYRYKDLDCVEISVDILHDPEGFYIEQLDQSTLIKSAATPPAGSVAYKPIKDADSARVVYEPQKLNGNGELPTAGAESYGIWSDYAEVDFDTVGLVQTIGSS